MRTYEELEKLVEGYKADLADECRDTQRLLDVLDLIHTYLGPFAPNDLAEPEELAQAVRTMYETLQSRLAVSQVMVEELSAALGQATTRQGFSSPDKTPSVDPKSDTPAG